MKTLFPAIRVSDLDASLSFYRSVGYEVVGTVAVNVGTRLAMLALPGEAEVSLELVHRPADGRVSPGGFDHLAVQVNDLAVTRELLMARALGPGAVETPAGADGPRTSWVADPDGYRLELVQWPDGHPVGMTRDDFHGAPPDMQAGGVEEKK
jgi:lactoylglutathione lyase